MAESAGQKTEEPTPKREADARKRGQVAQSRDLTSAATLAAALAGVIATGGHLAGELIGLVARSLQAAQTPSSGRAAEVLGDALGTTVAAVMPLLGMVVAAALLVGFLQTRGVFSTEPISPKLERLSPMAGLQRIFSVASVVETLKSVLKIAIALGVAYAVLREHVPDLVQTAVAPAAATAALAARLTTRVGWLVCASFAGLAVLDLLYQRHKHRKELRMTKQEVKDEHKQSEGDPHHRAERQRMHRELGSHAMLQDVRRAKVVVVNPEHLAVALVYEDGEEGAPRIVAKGADLLAQQIIEIAKEAGIPVLRNVPLAHALHRLELGAEIPEELYEAVAEVLQFVATLAKGDA